MGWLRDSITEVSQQNKEPFLFILLGEVVVFPVLRVSGCGSRIKRNHGGACTSATVRRRQWFQHWRLRFDSPIIADFGEKVKLNGALSSPISFGLWRYSSSTASAVQHNAAYDTLVTDSVTGDSRGVAPTRFERATFRLANGRSFQLSYGATTKSQAGFAPACRTLQGSRLTTRPLGRDYGEEVPIQSGNFLSIFDLRYCPKFRLVTFCVIWYPFVTHPMRCGKGIHDRMRCL